MSEEIDFKSMNVFQKVNWIMSKVRYVQKTADIGYGRNGYKAVTHDHVTSLVQPLFVECGLVAIPEIVEHVFSRYDVTTKNGTSDRYQTDLKVRLNVVNVDAPDEHFSVTAVAQGLDPQDKASGKAYSMAVKYCYLKMLMLESGDDEEQRLDDGKVQSPMADYKNKQPIIDKIQQLLTALTSGKTSEQKISFLKENLNISSFNELKKKDESTLNELKDKLEKQLNW